ncbi:unnamed protein product [Phytophthora lilii]|uniref:Peptidyl-prolyl cis-trans isomerase n=1 Tax=Phytophthora lilii TaxID=2077276 RepID=A0A9W7CY19_9STRA|nr:unnamed protein product [Phytophthora lilii]
MAVVKVKRIQNIQFAVDPSEGGRSGKDSNRMAADNAGSGVRTQTKMTRANESLSACTLTCPSATNASSREVPTVLGSAKSCVIKGFMPQGGETIDGGKFADEIFHYRYCRAGLKSMVSAGPNSNGIQFFITTAPTPHLDGKHVVFGEVASGMDVVRKMENVDTVAKSWSVPMQAVVIEDVGKSDSE